VPHKFVASEPSGYCVGVPTSSLHIIAAYRLASCDFKGPFWGDERILGPASCNTEFNISFKEG